MLELSGYRVVEPIGSDGEIRLYRIARTADGLPLIAKTTSDTYVGSDMAAALQAEYEALIGLNGKGVLEPYGLEKAGEKPVLLLRDPGGMTLEHWMRTRRASLKLPELLRAAIALAESLLQVHKEQITLHQITPFSFMLSDNLEQVRFLDLRSSSAVRGVLQTQWPDQRPDKVLPYLSPEHTGRTGRIPDYRSDIYALGAVLYEWFSGTHPFQAAGALDLVHQHLAAAPEPVHTRNPSIPRIVSDIIIRCLDKMPEKRYASAYGIKSDLEECLTQLRISGRIRPFPLGNHEISEGWMTAETLLGRKAEREELLQALRRASEGPSEVIWIRGNAGIGKTALVLEALRHVEAVDTIIVSSGPSASAAVQPPYSLWVQVLEQLVGRVLTLDDSHVEAWKSRVADALQGEGQLLIDLVPRLALLVGTRPEPAEDPSERSHELVQLVLGRFLQALLDQPQPVVLFLDDLQWADEASIQYLYHWLKVENAKRLLIVGAYLDEEPESNSLRLLEQVKGQLTSIGRPTREIHLTAFDHRALKEMLGPLIHGSAHQADELVQVLLQKTGGNPADVKQFLQKLRDRKLVVFDEQRRVWSWDVRRITEMNVLEHVADSIEDTLLSLPGQTLYILGLAAILGKQFDLGALVALSGLPAEHVRERVQNAVADRLLQPIHGTSMVYAFQHDRIWQFAYESVSEGVREEMHMRTGWLLAERMQAGEDVALDKVLSHLNQAVERIILQGRSRELAELNMQAGRMAKEAAAFEASLHYYRLAAELLAQQDGWESSYTLTYEAYMARAEAEFRNTNFQTAHELFELIMEKARTDLEKAQACLLMIRLDTNSDRFPEVLALGERALGLLGLKYSAKPNKRDVFRQFIRMRLKLRKISVESLGHLAPMTDVRYQTAMSVLDYISHVSFVMDKTGWLSLTLTMLELTLEHGMTPEASIGFVGYAMVLNFNFRQYEAAYQWGRLAYQVARANPRLYAVIVSSFAFCYDSWRRYEPGFLPVTADHAVREALQSGDLWHANQTMLVNCAMLFHYSHPIKDIYIRLVEQAVHLQRNRNGVHHKQAVILAQLLSELSGYRVPSDSYAEIDILSESFYAGLSRDDHYYLQAYVYVYQFIKGYLLGQYEEAHIALEECLRLEVSKKGSSLDPSVFHYFRVLVLKERYATADRRERTEYRHQIRASTRKLKGMASRSPDTVRHKYLLAKAEVAKLSNQDHKAERLYEQALEAARTSGHTHDAGIIAESLGQYGLLRGKTGLARFYLNEAYESYLKWGALAKTAAMETKYAQLLQLKRASEPDMERIDYLSVMNSAQALSGEMEMDKLSRMLMRIMLQNAGAEYGALLFSGEEGWTVEAYGKAEELIIESLPLAEAEHLVPTAVIGYAARTSEAVVLHDAASDIMFGRNEYMRRKANKSVLCLPILYQNQLIGQLYMENNLSTGVFREKQLDVLKMLSAQCAISIANAKLYLGMQNLKNSLEEQVEQRTRALERSMRATSEALAETTVYAERNRIAQEIHDIVGHTLTSTVLQIEAGKRLLSKDMDSAVARLKEAQDLVRHSLNEIRNSVHMLKEDKYYDLESAMCKLIQDTERNTGVVIHHAIDPVQHMSFMHKKLIYHALQEGLTNGIRHGGSSEFHFSLQDHGSELSFRLADNGKGGSLIEMGFGLSMMQDRVLQLEGALTIDAEPGRGCVLRIHLPYST